MKDCPGFDLARFLFAFGLLFAFGTQVRAQAVVDWTKYTNTIPPDSDTTNSNSRIGMGTNTRGDDALMRVPAVILVGDRDYKMS